MAENRLKTQLSGLFSDLNDVADVAQTSKPVVPEKEVAGQLPRQTATDLFSIELKTVTAISNLTATIFDLDKLLKQIVDLIKVNFDLYHVQIYSLDKDAENLSLIPTAGSGIIGPQIRAYQHAVPLNDQQVLAARSARNKSAEINNTLYEDFDFSLDHFLPDARSELAVPLIILNQVMGVLDIYSAQPNHFKLQDTAVYTVLATQIIVAEQNTRLLKKAERQTIENKRLFEQTQAALSATERLYGVSQRINMAANLDDILAAVVEELPVSGINRALLFTFEHDLAGEVETATIAANWYSGDGTPPFPIGERYPRSMFTAIKPFLGAEASFIENAQNNSNVDESALFVLKQQNIHALAVLPLQVGARELGTLVLLGEVAHHFTQRETQSYLSVAPQIAAAVENGRLLMETRAVLAEIEETQKRYTAQSWEHYRSDADQETLNYEQVREGVMPMADELPPEINRAISQTQTVIIEGDEYNNSHASEPGVGSSLIVPLTLRNEVIGILGLQETEMSHSWFPEEIALVEAIAIQFSQVAEELRLLDEVQQRAAREHLTRQITNKVRAAHSVEGALQTAVEELSKALGQAHTFVTLETG